VSTVGNDVKNDSEMERPMPRKGFLLVLMQPPPAFEEEFNAWYDSEHIPERAAIPGFETALRFISTGAAPRYLAMYDLADRAVLDSDAYVRVAGENSTPWTKRVTGRVRSYRSVGEQVWPGTALTPVAARVHIVRFRGLDTAAEDGVVTAMRTAFEGRGATLGVRVFAYPVDGKVDYLGVVSCSAPGAEAIDPKALGAYAGAIDLFNTYTPY
jgi:hypothetical protein